MSCVIQNLVNFIKSFISHMHRRSWLDWIAALLLCNSLLLHCWYWTVVLIQQIYNDYCSRNYLHYYIVHHLYIEHYLQIYKLLILLNQLDAISLYNIQCCKDHNRQISIHKNCYILTNGATDQNKICSHLECILEVWWALRHLLSEFCL
jgi:hypothetical protein